MHLSPFLPPNALWSFAAICVAVFGFVGCDKPSDESQIGVPSIERIEISEYLEWCAKHSHAPRFSDVGEMTVVVTDFDDLGHSSVARIVLTADVDDLLSVEVARMNSEMTGLILVKAESEIEVVSLFEKHCNREWPILDSRVSDAFRPVHDLGNVCYIARGKYSQNENFQQGRALVYARSKRIVYYWTWSIDVSGKKEGKVNSSTCNE